MKPPLHKQLTNYIRLHRQVSYNDIQEYAKSVGNYAYTAIRRLQEVRQPEHRNFDKDIGVIMEGTAIKWYIYKPAFMTHQTQETPRREEIQQPATKDTPKPATEPNIAPQPTSDISAKEALQIYEQERKFLGRPPKASELKVAIERYKKAKGVRH
jgi:hypothetical protein